MPDSPEPAPKPTVGRTWADATVDLARLLGSLAPIAIVVAGALFALYMFREQADRSQKDLREAREQVSKLNETERQAASKALQDSYGELRQTYQAMGTLSEHQIGNVKKLLELHGEVATSTEAQRDRLRKLDEDATRQMKQAEEARAGAAKAKDEAQQAVVRKQEIERDAGDLDRKVAALRAQHAELQQKLKREQEKVGGAVGDIGRLREQLDRLAGSVVQGPADEAKSLATGILAELREPTQVLGAYAASRDKSAAADLKRLVGLSAASFEERVRQVVGYAVWLKALDKSAAVQGYLGVVRQREAEDEGAVVLEVNAGNISDISVLDVVLALAATDVDNWQKKQTYHLSITDGRVEEGAIRDGAGSEWSYQLLVEPGERVEVVSGTEHSHRVMTPEEFAQQHRSVYDRFKQGKDQASLALRMEGRAQGFDAARAMGNLAAVQLGPLHDALVALANAAVRREPKSRDFLAEGAGIDLPGRLAALALRDDFRVLSASVEDFRPANPATQQTPAAGRGAGDRTARIVVEAQGRYGSMVRNVLSWREAPGGHWLLAAVEAGSAAAR